MLIHNAPVLRRLCSFWSHINELGLTIQWFFKRGYFIIIIKKIMNVNAHLISETHMDLILDSKQVEL